MDPKTLSGVGAKEPEKMCVSDDKSVSKDEEKKDNKAKGWFLTYPQCPASPRSCLEDLQDKLMEKKGLKIVEYVICQEKHQNGDLHLHAFIKLDKRIRFNKNLFDFIFDKKDYHGHYEKAKSWRAVKDYIVKDGNYISNINIENAKNGHSKKIGIKELEMDALDLLENGTITGFQLNNFIKNQNVYRLLKRKREIESEPYNLEIEKKRHVWYYGESNSGKTYRLWKMINENPKDWFQIPDNNDWIGYNNEKNLFFDEFRGQLTIQELNRICDGGKKVNVKGGTTVLNKECVVYIISNFNIQECYKKAEKNILETLYNRFNEKMCAKDGDKYILVE